MLELSSPLLSTPLSSSSHRPTLTSLHPSFCRYETCYATAVLSTSLLCLTARDVSASVLPLPVLRRLLLLPVGGAGPADRLRHHHGAGGRHRRLRLLHHRLPLARLL